MKHPTLAFVLLAAFAASARAQPADALCAGFAEADITPDPLKKPVWLAGFGKNRKAAKVHDPLLARAVVLEHGKNKIALASVDLVGLFNDVVLRVRKQLPGFDYILVSSTHNHEGPDTIGMWGPNLFVSGIDPDYLKQVEAGLVQAIRSADKNKQAVRAEIGSATGPELLHDAREPQVKHDELVALRFTASGKTPSPPAPLPEGEGSKKGPPLPGGEGSKTLGIVVQWNCHPETLSSKNTEISADYVGYTVDYLQKKYRCPVVYLTGTVGGLMTSLHVEIKDDKGEPLADGTFEKTARYGRLVGELADKALKDAKPAQLTPFEVRTKTFFMPIDNTLYILGFNLGVLKRDGFVWEGDPLKAQPVLPSPPGRGVGGEGPAKIDKNARLCIQSEIGWLRLGDLEIAAIPGEIYPELVLSKVQDPPDPGADFPKAPIEPGIYAQMKSRHRMLIGLANDEIGYILPKRQWDAVAPYCYGRKKAQYGEENSLGPETGPIVCEVFRALLKKK